MSSTVLENGKVWQPNPLEIEGIDLEVGNINTIKETIESTAVGAAVVGGVVIAGGIAATVLPNDVKEKIKEKGKRRVSFVKHIVEETKEKNPCCFNFLKTCSAIFSTLLYYLDVYTDVVLMVTFYNYGYMVWFWLTLSFVGLNYLLGVGGVLVYLYTTFLPNTEDDEARGIYVFLTCCCCCLPFPFAFIIPLLLDTFMPFYNISFVQKCMSNEFINFMKQYEATRKLCESFFESFPQTCLQVIIFIDCNGNDCKGIEKEAFDALVMSLTISVIAILYHAATSYFEMKKEGLSFCEYFQSLLKMGAGLPLRGIAHNTLDIVDLENVTLLDAQVILLSNAMKDNTSVKKLNLNKSGITDEGIKVLAEMLKVNSTLMELNLSDNDIGNQSGKLIIEALKMNSTLTILDLSGTSVDTKIRKEIRIRLERNALQMIKTKGRFQTTVKFNALKLTNADIESIGEGLKTNNTLETLELSNNNITDVQSIGEGLKTNNTLQYLSLSNNNITDDSGIQSIIDGLKTNNTLKTLFLHNNQLSRNMKSQLNAIEQYKRDGSNGYQQVEGMYIYT